MDALNNMKVGTKLSLGFAIAISLLLVIVATSMTNMSGMNSATEEILSERYAKVQILNDLMQSELDNTRQIRNLLLVADTEIAGVKQRIADNQRKNGERMQDLEKTVKIDKGRELLSTINGKRSVLNSKRDRFYQLLLSSKTDATEFFLNP